MAKKWGAHIPTKISVGIILCRQNEQNKRIEALLVHKRYTYAFAEFVLGRYSASPEMSIRAAADLLSRMTREELFDVYSLNFEQMWFRIWLTHANIDLYAKKHARFFSTFMHDGGETLRRLVSAARNSGVLMWEVPKGRRYGIEETDISCAIREFYEETGIEKKDYRILPGVKRSINYVSAGIRYICIYYIALANPHIASSSYRFRTLKDINLMTEIDEQRWFDIEQIRFIETTMSHLTELVTPAFKLVKKYIKGDWESRTMLRSKIRVKLAPTVKVD